MTFFHISLGKLILPAAALTASVFGFTADTNAHSSDDGAEPMTCEIAVTRGQYGHTYEGIVHAATSMKGTYELSLKKRGAGGRAMINQSGDFHVAAGQSETLGQATFGGMPPNSVNAELTLRWNGHKMTCTNATDL